MNYLDYFKNPGFKRFIIGVKNKYQTLGRFTGIIKLENITEEEKIALEKFFGEKYNVGDSISISLKKFDKLILKSKFIDFNYMTLIKYCLDLEEIKTNKDKRQETEDMYLDFMEDILNIMQNKELVDFLVDKLSRKTNFNKIIRTRYTKNKNELKDILLKIDKLFSNKPNYPISLPMYARITGNPHFLDFNTSTGSLFLKILSNMEDKKIDTIQDKWDLLENINVYNDTISNYTMTNNLLGDKDLEEFNKKFGPINLNIDNVTNLNIIKGVNNKIYIFENPSLLNYFKKQNISIIITSGIPNLSFYKLMEKIDKNTDIYYNGDFDPEGVLIANKLKILFPRLNLMCYNKGDYLNTCPNEFLNSRRLKKLEHINISELREIKEILKENKMSGYQENNLEGIKKFILNERK